MNYDLIIKNGTVIDPGASASMLGKMWHSRHGHVSAISDDIPASEAREVLDAEGCLVTRPVSSTYTFMSSTV